MFIYIKYLYIIKKNYYQVVPWKTEEFSTQLHCWGKHSPNQLQSTQDHNKYFPQIYSKIIS